MIKIYNSDIETNELKNVKKIEKGSWISMINPTEEEIKHYLTGNLCRCTGYMGQLRAIKTYMGVR